MVQAAPYLHLSASDGCWFQPPWFDRRGDGYDHSGVGVLLAFDRFMWLAGFVVATVGVVLVALAVLVVYLRMPQLFAARLLPLRLTCRSVLQRIRRGVAPKAKSATSEPATGS